MAGLTYKGKTVFGLDIGTRSIVGTVGYNDGDRFVVLAQKTMEHDTRSMLDGQIHDVKKVGQTIARVKESLEEELGAKLSEVCIAAAGRVLQTVNVHVEQEFAESKLILEEDVYALSAQGVEKAYEEFQPVTTDEDLKFYCVGYSISRYYMNGYLIGNPEQHKASSIGADMIATFLPEDVVDGLYRAVEIAGLEVANLTLEPIAAIQVAIPERFRMLNIALVDVGAGTSDISITNDGAILAYGMIPTAGDSLTEIIAKHCLTDFNTAEEIKQKINDAYAKNGNVDFVDIMGLPQSMKAEELLKILTPQIEDMTGKVADEIKRLNGDKPVSAVFVVGGGGRIEGYTKALADHLGLQKERVAVRGADVMGFVDFPEGIEKTSLLVTPIGICLTFYIQNNNFVFVTFNESRVKVYDNGKLSVVDAAMQSGFPNESLFPKRGEALNFTIDGKSRMKRGELGEAAIITVNGETADMHTPVKANDVIGVVPSTAGEPAHMEIGELPEYKQTLTVNVAGKNVSLPKFATVNGELQSEFYSIQNGDDIRMENFYTLEKLLQFLDLNLPDGMVIYVNNMVAKPSTKVYENFSVSWVQGSSSFADLPEDDGEMEAAVRRQAESMARESEQSSDETADVPLAGDADAMRPAAEDSVANRTTAEAVMTETSGADTETAGAEAGEDKEETATEEEPVPVIHSITLTVNNRPITLNGQTSYIFVNIFDYIDFDLKNPKGAIVTKLNGRSAGYLEEIKDGDVVEIYWDH